MKYIECKNYEELSKKAAEIIAQTVNRKSDCLLGLATGSSPLGTYKRLIEMNQNGQVDFSGVRTVNLDEYVGLTGDNNQSYRFFMDNNLFNHINIKKENTHVPDGVSTNAEEHCVEYDNNIIKMGGVDLQLLGIGIDGHIGFNEPGEVFKKITHVEELDKSTIAANARFFESENDVPKKAITMGIGTIMRAKKILLIANGKAKKEIVNSAIFGEVTPKIPASILQFHPDVTVLYCD